MSHWFEASAVQKVCNIIQKKWVNYKDDEQGHQEENEVLEKFQNIRHVSIIIPQVFEDLENISEKYEA